MAARLGRGSLLQGPALNLNWLNLAPADPEDRGERGGEAELRGWPDVGQCQSCDQQPQDVQSRQQLPARSQVKQAGSRTPRSLVFVSDPSPHEAVCRRAALGQERPGGDGMKAASPQRQDNRNRSEISSAPAQGPDSCLMPPHASQCRYGRATRPAERGAGSGGAPLTAML